MYIVDVRHGRDCHEYFNLSSSAVCTENTCDFPRARCCSGYDMMQDTGMALSAWLQETDCREEYMGEPRVNRRHDSAARRSQCDTHSGLSIRWSNRLPRAVMFKGPCAEHPEVAASQNEASPETTVEAKDPSWRSRSQNRLACSILQLCTPMDMSPEAARP